MDQDETARAKRDLRVQLDRVEAERSAICCWLAVAVICLGGLFAGAMGEDGTPLQAVVLVLAFAGFACIAGGAAYAVHRLRRLAREGNALIASLYGGERG